MVVLLYRGEFKTFDQTVTPHAVCLLCWRLVGIICLALILTDVSVRYTQWLIPTQGKVRLKYFQRRLCQISVFMLYFLTFLL